MSLEPLGQIPKGERLTATVAIIGAGPAGITLALQLSARGVDVILLEAGGTEYDERTQKRYEGPLSVGDNTSYPPLEAWRLRMLGGTSNHWGGWCRRLEANVFEPRPWLDDTAWPFDRSELEDGYRRAQQTCELGRDNYEADSLQADLGMTPWSDLDRHGLQTSIWRFSPPTRFGTRYRPDLETAPLRVITGANVVSIDTTGDAVDHLALVGEDGASRSVTADTFVLAAGGLESVRMLLLLDEASQTTIDTSGWLGRGFMEHPHGIVGAVVTDGAMADDTLGPLTMLRERQRDVDGVRIRAGITVGADACADLGLVNMSFTIDPVEADALTLNRQPRHKAISELVELLSNGRSSAPHWIYARSEQQPSRSSQISLTRPTDDLGMKRIRLDWRIEPGDLSNLTIGVSMLTRAFASLGIAIVRNPAIDSPDVGLTGGGHHMGGARIHEDPRHGVVDPSLRVHSLRNLYVCSAAVFPSSCYSNPTMTIVALAHRLADEMAGG